MTFAPPTLTELARFWTSHGGVNLGIVGDTGHIDKGTSYHLGRSQLARGAYSAVTARDRAGLSEAASAIDLGKLDGSLADLRTFSRWLVSQARRNAPGTRDMREIIYSPYGRSVFRWDRQRGYASVAHPGEADLTHLTHTHVSFYRDAEKRDHTTAFRPYFEEEPMRSFALIDGPTGTVTVKGPGHSYLLLADGTLHTIGAGTVKHPAYPIRLIAPIPGGVAGADRQTGWLVGVNAAFLLASDVTFVPEDCAAAIAADRAKARIVWG